MMPPTNSRWNTARTIAVATILVLVGWLIARTWFARTAVIVSESMAPALLGPHLVATCPCCRQTTEVGWSEEESPDRDLVPSHPVACWNCGTLILMPSDTPIEPGSSLWVRRGSSAPSSNAFSRWSLVACQDPESPENVIVKRLVGMPGETVQIVDGDVHINGQIARKSLEQQAAMAVPVYYEGEDRGQRTEDRKKRTEGETAGEGRWRGVGGESGWSVKDGHFRFAGGQKKGAAERLVYHHERRRDGRMVEGPIDDQLAYNQWLPIRRDTPSPVSDLMLAFHLRHTAGQGYLKVFTSDDRYVVTFDFGRKKVLAESGLAVGHRPTSFEAAKHAERGSKAKRVSPGDRNMAEGTFTPPSDGTPLPILVSTVDRCLMVVVDRTVVIEVPLSESVSCGSTPFSFEVSGLDVDLHRVRIYRDVFYTRPTGIDARWAIDEPVRLGENEYFVLGDNPHVSQDSRIWPQGPAIHGRQIFGQPMKMR